MIEFDLSHYGFWCPALLYGTPLCVYPYLIFILQKERDYYLGNCKNYHP